MCMFSCFGEFYLLKSMTRIPKNKAPKLLNDISKLDEKLYEILY